MKHFNIVYFFITIPLFANFNSLWYETQNMYQNLIHSLEDANVILEDTLGCHQEWLKFRQDIKHHILGEPKRDFLNTQSVKATMLRMGIGQAEQYELTYLKKISSTTSQLISKFIETDFHLVPKECVELNCTSTSLSHLFYLAKILETWQTFKTNNFEAIVEFGGGFGNLCHIIHQIFPETTYILFDIPEVIALQYLFLKGALPTQEIKIHTHEGEAIQKKAINLIPSVFCEKTMVKADVFISTFALSETSEQMQHHILNKKYYDADLCYITGQRFKKSTVTYVNHTIIQNSVQANYSKIILTPFHAPIDCDCTYELIGIK